MKLRSINPATNKLGKVAVVTGSSRGIGAGIAKYLLDKQFTVYITYLKEKNRAEELFASYDRAIIKSLDVTNEASVKTLFTSIAKDQNGLDLLVNSAAIEIPGTLEEISLQTWRKVVDAKLTGAFLVTKYAVPLLKKRKRSTIVNITSSLSHKGAPKYPAHAAAEAGLISLSKTCAIQLAPYGIRTHMVNPTTTRTEMWKDIGGYEDEELWQRFANNNPLGRVSTPEDIGKAIYLLTTDEAEYWNGNEIYVNGGAHIK